MSIDRTVYVSEPDEPRPPVIGMKFRHVQRELASKTAEEWELDKDRCMELLAAVDFLTMAGFGGFGK